MQNKLKRVAWSLSFDGYFLVIFVLGVLAVYKLILKSTKIGKKNPYIADETMPVC